MPEPMPCPWLPAVSGRLEPSVTRRHGKERGAAFYHDALCYAQSQWLHGKPAQAILQLNKAWMARLDAAPEFPPPYRALVWLLQRAGSGDFGFIGNPPRHFQHLATRMSGPDSAVRSCRAWICFHLATVAMEGMGYDRDGVQLAREGIWIPGWDHALHGIHRMGWPGEAVEAESALAVARPYLIW